MQALKEVTVWRVDYPQPNHTYLMDGDRILAYLKWGEGEPIFSPSRIRMDKRGRKFIPADITLFGPVQVDSHITTVAGSKPGVVYQVNTQMGTCTCPGYTFRGACKHIKQLETA